MIAKTKMKFGIGEPVSIGRVPGFIVVSASHELGEYVLSRGQNFYLFDPDEGLKMIGQAEAYGMIADSLRRAGIKLVDA